MKQKYLILKGVAGLGNRLYTLANAIEYTKKTNRTLLVDWNDGQFGTDGDNVFYNYFDLINVPHIKSLDEIDNYGSLDKYPTEWGKTPTSKLYDLYESASSDKLKRIPRKLVPKGDLSKIISYWKFIDNERQECSNKDLESIRAIFNKHDIPFGEFYSLDIKEDVVFFSDFSPSFREAYLINNIKLKENIIRKIDYFTDIKKLSKNTVGVHVRYTDKTPNKDLMTLFEKVSLFVEKGNQVFLSTDSLDVQNEFKKRYSNFIIYTNNLEKPKKGRGIHQIGLDHEDNEYKKQMTINSIIDMWLLSRCEHLLYQGNSSFSTVSKILHNDQNKVYDWQE